MLIELVIFLFCSFVLRCKMQKTAIIFLVEIVLPHVARADAAQANADALAADPEAIDARVNQYSKPVHFSVFFWEGFEFFGNDTLSIRDSAH